jgi:UDP-glucose 4-epimerase
MPEISTSPRPSRRIVLVTGGAGFVGSRLVELLAEAGQQVRVVDAVWNEHSDRIGALTGVAFRAVDLRDAEAVNAAVDGVSHVIHLAAVRTSASASNPRLSHDVNVSASYDLFATSARLGVQRIVFGSSHAVYGAFGDPYVKPLREWQTGGSGRGLNMYAATKLAAEAYLEAFANAGGPEYLSLRFGSIYGPRVAPGSNASILLDVLTAIDAVKRPAITWSRDSLHALIHVDDVARACIAALDATEHNCAVNVVGEPVSSEALYGSLVRLYGADTDRIDWLEHRRRYQLSDRSRLRSVLGITSSIPLQQGLRDFIDWHRSAL